MGSLSSLNLSNTKLNNQSMEDFCEMFKHQEMNLRELDIHSNQITTEGFYKLMVCLKTNNKVAKLNISKNQIATDLKMFKMVQKFLNSNKILEDFDLSFCGIDEKAGELIGKGLRGNRRLQSFILKGNPIQGAVREIAKSFLENKKALTIKVLDLSKCNIECGHITREFIDMIKSPFTTIKFLSLRDNFLKNRAGEAIKDALKENKTITKMPLDYNPIKAQCVKQIATLCKRNHQLDEINQKNKNIYELAQKKKKFRTQRAMLNNEIKDLKSKTDETINESQMTLTNIERLQCNRKSAVEFYQSVGNILGGSSLDTSMQHPGGMLSPAIIKKEPNTSLTKNTTFTNFTSSMIQHNRHQSQGPMRSEKVYLMTQMINQKIEQLASEKMYIKGCY